MCTYLPGWEFEMIDPLEGVTSPDDVELENEAVGGVPVETTAPSGRVLGRAQRKGKTSGPADTHHVPVELHVPEPNGPQMLHRGSNPATPTSPGRGRNQSSSSTTRPYEDLQRDRYRNEHAYDQPRVSHSGASPSHTHPTRDSPYEEMNMHRQPYTNSDPPPSYSSSELPPSYNTVSHIAPRTPTQHSSYSPRTPQSPHSPCTPHTPQSAYSPRTPTSPRSQPPSTDKYNTDYTPTRPSHQTYLTDDTNTAPHSPRAGQYSGHKYDSNYNKSIEQDRYGGDRYDPQDKYADHSFQPVPSPRGNFPPTHRPTVSPRGLHHHQGSGRSDTSASDSGFGESEESRHRNNDRYNNNNNRSNTPVKTPYYNHAYQHSPDSPDKEFVKNMAMAASQRMTQGHDGYRKQEFYSDDKYGRELQKWRQNINDLEEACDVPQSEFRGTQLRMNSNNEEPMEESFI